MLQTNSNPEYYLTFEITLKPENSAFLMQIARFDRLSNLFPGDLLLFFLLLNVKKLWQLDLILVRHSCTLLYQYIFFV